jgi:hypothetical protein
MRRKTAYVLWATFCLVPFGCGDPVRTTRQTLSVRVVESASRDPIAGLNVQIKKDYEHSDALAPEVRRFPKEHQDYLREWWRSLPWSSCVTDKYGQAEAAIVRTALDRTRGAKPPPSRDTITGEPYLVKVNAAREPDEVLSVLMKPGEVVRGKQYTVTVVDIREPVYIGEP